MTEERRNEVPLSLSVVIPCLNAAETLGVQLEALTRQHWDGPWEVIVADNGSTDGSRDVVEAYQGRLPDLRSVQAVGRGGPGHARNAGAAAARGDALLFCDADDEVADGWLEALGRGLREHPFLACRFEIEKLNQPWVAASKGNPQDDGLNPYTYPPYLPHAGAGGLAVRAEVHHSVGGFDETLPALEDTDYCWRIQRTGVPLTFCREAVVHVRFRPSMKGIFLQGASYGRHNVLIYKKYRELPDGMPPLPPLAGLLKWVRLGLSLPKVLTRVGRAQWLWQAGWRWGRLQGCWAYRVWAL